MLFVCFWIRSRFAGTWCPHERLVAGRAGRMATLNALGDGLASRGGGVRSRRTGSPGLPRASCAPIVRLCRKKQMCVCVLPGKPLLN